MKVGDPVLIYKCPEWFNSGGIGLITGRDPNDGSLQVKDFNEYNDFDAFVKPENLHVLDFEKPKEGPLINPVIVMLFYLLIMSNVILGSLLI